jgi:hypothetical protein
MKWEIYCRITIWISVMFYQLLGIINFKCKMWTEN